MAAHQSALKRTQVMWLRNLVTFQEDFENGRACQSRTACVGGLNSDRRPKQRIFFILRVGPSILIQQATAQCSTLQHAKQYTCTVVAGQHHASPSRGTTSEKGMKLVLQVCFTSFSDVVPIEGEACINLLQLCKLQRRPLCLASAVCSEERATSRLQGKLQAGPNCLAAAVFTGESEKQTCGTDFSAGPNCLAVAAGSGQILCCPLTCCGTISRAGRSHRKQKFDSVSRVNPSGRPSTLCSSSA